jgi:RNA polymerase sigma factor (sigma-70 family)
MPWFKKTASDAAVVLRVRAGRRDEFAALVDRYLPVAHAVCYAQLRNVADAEDAAQDAFIKAYEALDGLREPAKFGPWLLSIVRNVCRNHQRSRAREAERIDAIAMLGQAPVTKPEEQELRLLVRKQVEGLDDIHREALLLHYYGGRSIKEIAALLELSPDAVKKRLQRAREALSAQMLQHLEPAVAPQGTHRDRVKTIMGLLAGVTAAWEAGAASTTGVAAGAGAAGVAGTLASGAIAKIIAGVAAAIAVSGAVLYWPDAPEPVKDEAIQTGISQDAGTLASATPGPIDPTDPTDRSDPSEVSQNAPPIPQNGFFIRGRTVDQSGNPVANAAITLDPAYPDAGKHHETKSNDDGWFLFQDVAGALFALQASGSNLFGADEVNGAPKNDPVSHTVTMLPAGALEGIVANKNGEPVPNARVMPIAGTWMGEEEFLSRRWAELRAVETDENGRFTLAPVFLGTWRLRVESVAYVIKDTEPLDVASSPVTITLVPGAHVEGRVVYAGTNTPVPDLKVSVGIDRWTVTDQDGGFVLDGVNPGTHTGHIEHDTLLLVPKRFYVLEGSRMTGVTVEVVQGGIVTGRVYDAQTGEGIEATVRLERLDRTSTPYDTSDDQSGVYRVTKLLPGTYHVDAVSAHEYLRLDDPGHDPLEIEYGKTIVGVDFGLIKGAEIRGNVEAPTDASFDELTISARYSEDASETYRGQSNVIFKVEAGDFTLKGIAPGEPVTVQATAKGWASETVGPFTLGREGVNGISLTLVEWPIGSIAGRVVFGAGKPYEGARVSIKGITHNHNATANTRADGTFAFHDIPPDEYRANVEIPGYPRNVPESVLTLAPGQTVEDLVIDLGGGSGSIAGQVVDDAGSPIERVQLGAQTSGSSAPPTTSEEDGAFILQGLEAKRYEVTAYAEGYVFARLEDVPTGTSNLRIVLDRMGVIEGRVIDGRTGQPVSECEVAVRTPEHMALENWTNLSFSRFMNDTGAFRVDNRSQGRYVVVARAPGLFPETVETQVQHGQTVTIPDIVLRPGAVAHVTVVNAQGQPLSGAEVYANDWSNLNRQSRLDNGSIKTNTEGLATLKNFVPGKNLIYVTHSDYVPSQFELDVHADATLSRTFTLLEGGVLEGVVTADGSPVPDTQIRLSYADADLPGFERFHTEAQTDAQGAYRITGLVAGEVIVVVHGKDQNLQRNVVVTRAQTARADFSFGTGTATVTGTVPLPTDMGEPPQVAVTLSVTTRMGQVLYNTTIDSDGGFAFSGVQAGEATLMVSIVSADRRRHSNGGTTLTILPGSDITLDFNLGQSWESTP